MTPRVAYPPQLSATELGPVIKHQTCAFAARLGCGLLVARFYISGWRCEGHRP